MPPKILDGRYEIHEPLGAGGMARVFRGLDVELRRPVAIKLLPEDRARDEHLRARMVREAQAMARLNHPHVVQVYGCSRPTSDTPYIASELVDGIDLGEALLENGSMPWELALWVVERCLAGLAAIHATSIVHRDLKPSNILLTRDGTPKIGDLGLAHLADRTGITAVGARPGTLMYTPPEAFEFADPKPGFDIYAMGCVLYELIAGTPAFEREGSKAIIAAIRKGAYEPLERRIPEVPAAVSAIVKRALAINPADRPPTAEAMRQDCRAQLEAALAVDLAPFARQWVQGPADRSWVDQLRARARALAQVGAATAPATPPRRFPALASVALGIATTLGLAAAWTYRDAPPPAPSPTPSAPASVTPKTPANPARVTVVVPHDVRVETLDGTCLAVGEQAFSLSAGRHQLVLRSPDMEDASLDLNVAPGDRKTFRPVLTRRRVSVEIKTAPPGATIAVDGQPRGQVTELTLLAGQPSRVTASKEGYRPAEQVIVARASHKEVVELTLSPDTLDPPGAPVDPIVDEQVQDGLRSTADYLEKRLYSLAEMSLETVESIEPHSVRVRMMRGRLHSAKGADQLAEAVLGEALGVEPANPELLELLARIELRLGKHAAAEVLARRLVQVDPLDASHLATLATVLCASGRDAAARETAERSLRCNPDQATEKVLREILAKPCTL